MLLISLENCSGCNLFKQAHPEIPYIELPRNRIKDTEQSKTIRTIIDRLNIHEFPVILNDELTEAIPLYLIDDRWPKPPENTSK